MHHKEELQIQVVEPYPALELQKVVAFQHQAEQTLEEASSQKEALVLKGMMEQPNQEVRLLPRKEVPSQTMYHYKGENYVLKKMKL